MTHDTLPHDHFLDTSGLDCPLPVLKTRKKLSEINASDTLLVRVTDPGAPQDITMLAKKINAHILAIHSRKHENAHEKAWDIFISHHNPQQ